MFRPVSLKQLKGLILIDMFSLLGGRKVTLHTVVQAVPGLVPGSGKDFCVCFCFALLFWFLCAKGIIYI